jgi:hypothetical protein
MSMTRAALTAAIEASVDTSIQQRPATIAIKGCSIETTLDTVGGWCRSAWLARTGLTSWRNIMEL